MGRTMRGHLGSGRVCEQGVESAVDAGGQVAREMCARQS